MRSIAPMISIGLLTAMLAGCRDAPPPQRVPVPATDNREMIRETGEVRPAPPRRHDQHVIQPRFDDVPLVNQRPPEQRAYVQTYYQVGQPRITVFVNRTLEGELIPVNPDVPVAARQHTRQATGAVTVERDRTTTRRDYWGSETDRQTDRFEADGPVEYRETTELYLQPDEYDEALARSLDYETMELILADWLAANGQVAILSPMMARDRLTDEQLQELEAGRPQVLREIAQQLDADVLIHVQARPTRQTRYGLEIRVIAEAINTRDGLSIGRAAVDIPPPLEKTQLNHYTRFLARKLMDDMTATWATFIELQEQE